MVETLGVKFREAVPTSELKPREQWLFDPAAQVYTELYCIFLPLRFIYNFWYYVYPLHVVFTGLLLFYIQITLACTQIWWTNEVGNAFARLEEGYENAMKDFFKKQLCDQITGSN